MGIAAAAAIALSSCTSESSGSNADTVTTPTTSAATSAASSSASTTPSTTATGTPVAQAVIYGSATPPNANTQQMTLYHVDVPVGAVIAPHQHPGQQISHVTAGNLTYSVISGTVVVFDPPVDGKTGASRQVTGPATITVTPGMTLTEPAGEIHRATNTGPDVVRIDIAILVPQGDPLSVPAPA